MGPPTKALRTISQDVFDELVKENMGDLDMDPAEALQDAIDNPILQGVISLGLSLVFQGRVLVSALKTLALLLYDVPRTEIFRSSGGPTILANILKDGSESLDILDNDFTVLAAAATANEILKESFMELKIYKLMYNY